MLIELTEDKTFVKYSPGSISRETRKSWVYSRLVPSAFEREWVGIQGYQGSGQLEICTDPLGSSLAYEICLFVWWTAYGE
jgi:hypothetical protein